MVTEPVTPRYRNDGLAVIAMTEAQRDARGKVLVKILNGEYTFEDVDCAACNSRERRLLSQKDMYGLPMTVVLCTDCNLVYTSPRFTDETLSRFYNNEYRQLDRGVLLPQEDFFQLQWQKGESIFDLLVENKLIDLDHKLVVEIGCGAGGILAYFREQGCTVLGCDLGREYLEYGVSKHGLELRWGDLKLVRQIVAERRLSVGLIIYEQVFEHLPDPKRELHVLRHLMTPESILYIGVPGLKNIDAHYDSDFLQYLQIPHLFHFDLASLSRIAETCGFFRLVGDETVRSVFKIKTGTMNPVSGDHSSSDILTFLLAMEKRRRAKAFMRLPKTVVRSVGRSAMTILEKSSLPGRVKQKIIGLSKQAARVLGV
jgi:SAM-dependent methyltransferase